MYFRLECDETLAENEVNVLVDGSQIDLLGNEDSFFLTQFSSWRPQENFCFEVQMNTYRSYQFDMKVKQN